MKMNKILSLVILSVVIFASCTKNVRTEEKPEPYRPVTTASRNEVQRMQSLCLQDTLLVGSNKYTWVVERQPCDSLGIIEDEMGDKYAENILKLNVKKNGNVLLSHTFYKKEFKSLLDKKFYSYSIIDGCRFLYVKEGKIVFSLCLSYPDTDMSRPFHLIIHPDGSYKLEKDDIMDDDFVTDTITS